MKIDNLVETDHAYWSLPSNNFPCVASRWLVGGTKTHIAVYPNSTKVAVARVAYSHRIREIQVSTILNEKK